jgi:hypothetical protein
MIIGQMAEMKMVQIAAGCAPLNTSKPIGSQARGETGRSKAMIGEIMLLRKVKRPIKNPKGIPISAARPKPRPTRPSELMIL